MLATGLRASLLGGIIVLDFIDMQDPEHQRQVLRTLEKALEKDHAKTRITGVSELGLIEMARSYGLRGWPLYRDVILPAALPSILVGVRFSLGLVWVLLIVAETISAQAGIGYMTMNAREFLQTDVVLVGILLYAALGKGADLAAWVAVHKQVRDLVARGRYVRGEHPDPGHRRGGVGGVQPARGRGVDPGCPDRGSGAAGAARSGRRGGVRPRAGNLAVLPQHRDQRRHHDSGEGCAPRHAPMVRAQQPAPPAVLRGGRNRCASTRMNCLACARVGTRLRVGRGVKRLLQPSVAQVAHSRTSALRAAVL